MSLFHLFSRPKAEKQRGYAERGMEVLPSFADRSATALTPRVVVQDRRPSVAVQDFSSMSLHTGNKNSSSKVVFEEPPLRAPLERKTGPFEPPPLFLAYPQSTKNGLLELSTLSSEAIIHKSKGKKAMALSAPGALGSLDGISEDMMSFQTRRGPRATLKHVANGASANLEMPKKIFVLVTSGYLLQYNEDGPSDRLPEKMLHLSKDSAAFACDLLPGKHHVLQVSQAVDQDGVMIAASGSLLSKLGIRNAAAKRLTSGFLLVMPSGREMESWMTSIRREIENLGGQRVQPDPVRLEVNDATAKKFVLTKSLSSSRRYQIKRNPSTEEKPMSTTQATSPESELEPRISLDEEDDNSATIDGFETEAIKLGKRGPEAGLWNRATSDALSISSSTALSTEQQHLNDTRSSNSISNRSRMSQTPTIATTVGTSRTDSLAGSPPSPQALIAKIEPARDLPLPFKTRHRPMVPYTRRPTQHLSTPREGQTLPAINTSPVGFTHSPIGESSVARYSPPQRKNASPPKRMTAAQSVPNLKSGMSVREKHDSKMSSPPPIPAVDGERPASLVGDLPPPSTWSNSRSASRRTSVVHSPRSQMASFQLEAPPTRRTSMLQTTTEPTSGVPQDGNRTSELDKAKRISFSMPLKVNPSGPHAMIQPVNNSKRNSRIHDPDNAGESPIVHTLTAKVDSTKRVSFSQMHSSTSLPSPNGLQRSPSASPRLSLFPSPMPVPAGVALQPTRRSSLATGSTASLPTLVQVPGQAQAQATGRTLKRPASLQVRSDFAPFLSKARNSTGPPDVRAAPIRGMKPSRSASNVPGLAQLSESKTSSNTNSEIPSSLEEADRATPLLARSQSPIPSRPGSRSSVHKGIRTRSLPELDLGIPVVGLGPPAPPPSAPLPLLPPGSRPTSPTPICNVNSGIHAVSGLGIQVS